MLSICSSQNFDKELNQKTLVLTECGEDLSATLVNTAYMLS